MDRTHYISALVVDAPGVLQRIAGLFSRRGYNIDGVSVGGCEIEGMSRIVVAARGDDRLIGQICSQLAKLIDVVRVSPFSNSPFVSRELMLIKIAVTPESRTKTQKLIDTFHCSMIDAGARHLIVQAVGSREKNDALLQLLAPCGILEATRTGETAMSRS